MANILPSDNLHTTLAALVEWEQQRKTEPASYIHISYQGKWIVTKAKEFAASRSELAASIRDLAKEILTQPDDLFWPDVDSLTQKCSALAKFQGSKKPGILGRIKRIGKPGLKDALLSLEKARNHSFDKKRKTFLEQMDSWTGFLQLLLEQLSMEENPKLFQQFQKVLQRLNQWKEERANLKVDDPYVHESMEAWERGASVEFRRMVQALAPLGLLAGGKPSKEERVNELRSLFLSGNGLTEELSNLQTAFASMGLASCDASFFVPYDEMLTDFALMVDRFVVRMLALQDQPRLDKYGALRFSRKDSQHPLSRSHYVVRTSDGFEVLRYIHSEDREDKGLFNQESAEAKLFNLWGANDKVTFLRRQPNNLDFSAPAAKSAKSLYGLDPCLLTGARVPKKPGQECQELLVEKMDYNLDEWNFFLYDEGLVPAILGKVAHGVRALHRLDWIHQDLKLENVVINPEPLEVGIIDFGFASHVKEEDVLDHKGSFCFAAPELLTEKEIIGKAAGKALDVFSLGMMGWSLLLNKDFDITPVVQYAEFTRREIGYSDFEKLGLPSLAQAQEHYGDLGILLHAMIHPDPIERPIIEEVCDRLDLLA